MQKFLYLVQRLAGGREVGAVARRIDDSQLAIGHCFMNVISHGQRRNHIVRALQ
jgi:hypothetical protein